MQGSSQNSEFAHGVNKNIIVDYKIMATPAKTLEERKIFIKDNVGKFPGFSSSKANLSSQAHFAFYDAIRNMPDRGIYNLYSILNNEGNYQTVLQSNSADDLKKNAQDLKDKDYIKNLKNVYFPRISNKSQLEAVINNMSVVNASNLKLLLETEKEIDKLILLQTVDELNTYVSNVNSSISTQRLGVNDLSFLSAEYDEINRKIETINSCLAVYAVTSIFTGMIPVVIGMSIAVVAVKFVSVGVAQYEKYKELNYISSACLGFVTALMKNITEMVSFYEIATPLITESTPDEKKYLVDVTQSPTWALIQNNLWKFLIFLIGQIEFTIERLGEKQYLFWHLFLSRVTFSKNQDEKTRVDDKKNPVYAFKYTREYCDDEKKELCNNYNDILMRLLEKKMRELLGTINHKYKKSKTMSGTFANTFGISRTFEPESIDNYKIFITDKFNGAYSNSSASAAMLNGINGFCETLTRFAVELGLNSKGGGMGGSGKQTKRMRNFNKITKKKFNGGNNQTKMSGGGFLGWLTSRNAYQLYREMLREYTIMTANVAVVTTDYILHYNKFILFIGTEKYKEAYNKYKISQTTKYEKINTLLKDLDTREKQAKILNQRKEAETIQDQPEDVADDEKASLVSNIVTGR